MAQGSIQIWPPVTVNRIVQTLMFRLAMHPLITDPPIVDATGNPLRINRFRNFDGKELQNPTGITLSIFPYHYARGNASTNLTVNSENAGVTFDPKATTLGGGRDDMTAYHQARANIELKLHMFGYSQDALNDPDIIEGQDTAFI